MKHTHTTKTLALAAACLIGAQTALPTSYIKPSETQHRIGLAVRNAVQDKDRSMLPFLEEVAFGEENKDIGRSYAAEAYLKIATLDEATVFMRKLCSTVEYSARGGASATTKFLEKASAEEKDAEEGVRERLYALLLEIVQCGEYALDAHYADVFLLERMVPEYAASKQRAALQRYADTGNENQRRDYDPIKAHFDKIPPKDRPDLRARFPGLPPLDDPRRPVPYTWLVVTIFAILVLAGAVFCAVRRKSPDDKALP